MRIEIARPELLRVLSAVTKVVDTKNVYPILENVLLTATADRLTVRGTDLDIEVTASCEARCVPGVTTVPAKRLADIVKKLAGDTVLLEQVGDDLIVKAGRSRFVLQTIAPDGFPTLSEATYTNSFKVDLASLFAPVAFAIATDSTRFYLNGIYLHVAGNDLRAVATDGHRMGRFQAIELPVGAAGLTGVIVPAKLVDIIPPGEIDVDVSDRKIRLTAGAVVIVSKLIEGVYPDYERVTPKTNDRLCKFVRADLLQAVDRVGVMATDKGGKAIKLSLAPGQLRLTVRNEGDCAEDEVEAIYDGEPFEIGFNAQYLADIVGAVTGTHVLFAFGSTGTGPAVVSGEGPALYVAMPMLVS